jgi:hypothetical protein
MGDFHGEPTGLLENNSLKIEYMLNSPRIVRLIPEGKENLFADLENETITTPFGDFFLRGGHRLWHAPEEFPRTYIPDSSGSTTEAIENGVRIRQPKEPLTNVRKMIEVTLHPNKPKVTLHHELHNEGSTSIELAPWALTMIRLDGVAVVPQHVGDKNAMQPNRHLVFWPYSSVKDPRLEMADDLVIVRPSAKLPALKFGCLCTAGWMGYWIDKTFFVKRFDPPGPVENYPDWGCNVEVYCNDKFIELETLGPLTTLEPGSSVSHNEVWEIYDRSELDWLPEKIRQVLADS